MMQSQSALRCVLLVALLVPLGACRVDAEGPVALNEAAVPAKYASAQTQDVIERMVATHGGLETWHDAPSLAWHRVHTVYDREGKVTETSVMNEVIDPRSRRTYHEWPEAEAYVVLDGDETWMVNWQHPAPPRMVAGTGFYLGNAPWVSQDPGVLLGEAERLDRIPGLDEPVLAVPMTFDFNDDEMALYIDPESYQLRGLQFYFSDPDFLKLVGAPPEQKRIGPVTMVMDSYVEKDGLLLVGKYRAYGSAGNLSAEGEYSAWNLEQPFAEMIPDRPPEAEIYRTVSEAGEAASAD